MPNVRFTTTDYNGTGLNYRVTATIVGGEHNGLSVTEVVHPGTANPANLETFLVDYINFISSGFDQIQNLRARGNAQKAEFARRSA